MAKKDVDVAEDTYNKSNPIRRRLGIDSRLVVGVFGDVHILLGHRSMRKEILRAFELCFRQRLIRLELLMIGNRLRHIRARHGEQELSFLHVVSQPDANFDDAP